MQEQLVNKIDKSFNYNEIASSDILGRFREQF